MHKMATADVPTWVCGPVLPVKTSVDLTGRARDNSDRITLTEDNFLLWLFLGFRRWEPQHLIVVCRYVSFRHTTTNKSAFMHSPLTGQYGLSGCRRSGGMSSTRPKTSGSVVGILSRLISMWLFGSWGGWRREMYQLTFRGMGMNYLRPERVSGNGVRGLRVPPQSQTLTWRWRPKWLQIMTTV